MVRSSIYELTLRRAVDAGSPGVQRRQRKVLDTSGWYVRGEENLRGWQPKGDSLIFDHQWELEKMFRIEAVERVRHFLLLSDRLISGRSDKIDLLPSMKNSSSRMNLATLTAPTSPTAVAVEDASIYAVWEMSDREKFLCSKYAALIQSHIPLKVTNSMPPPNPKTLPFNPPSDDPSSTNSSPEEKQELDCVIKRSSAPEIASSTDHVSLSTLTELSKKVTFTPEMEEVRLSCVISKKGYISLLESKCKKGSWLKRWITVRRPYLFIHLEETDPIERSVINISTSEISYYDQDLEVSRTFTLITKYREYTFQAQSSKEIHEWLYALNPLLAGQMLSKSSRSNHAKLLEPSLPNHLSNSSSY